MAIQKTRRKLNVAQFLEAQINSSDKSQQDIADEVGFSKATMVSMIKLGKAKVPLDKARSIARSLGLDEKDFFFRCFEEYLPSIYDELVDLQGNQPILTDNEVEMIQRIRKARPENPGIKTAEQNSAFEKFIDTLVGE